ncbi:sodium-dependent neutral amino acid transporter B(0)AT3 isoform X2 [Contarinia nasturtii]|uniref:sodium-dependent neutral amino acid transporter B(0)AT3 isoform X2 n=1 Tax=Contarinia nasturtii TaxID=265458 RepID=UPI0012D3FBD9|nr:sodium-dependent neutral amino acid transporter B(0)AT3 isoform X2 [Contarinia nasturtii]
MTAKLESINGPRNGHEMAPLNTRARGDGTHGVTIVLSASQRNSIASNNGSVCGRNGGGDDDRAAWSGKMQFFLSIIGYSVGLGNIWRFPYLCQQNGGGAFLIPFFVMLILEGIPLFLIELGIGQRMRLGSLGVWNTIHPWLGGIGISSCIVTLFVTLYYNVVITWCFFYLLNSFRIELPWAKCPLFNETTTEPECKSSTTYFWYHTTLDASPSMEDSGGLKWWIVLCLFAAWAIVFLIVMKGIQSSGNIVWFTSLFPYIVLTIFFIRGITLEGASEGLAHMLKPDVKKLLKPMVWLDAATQVFYSFGLAFGSLIAFGSYNTPKNHCVRDVLLVSFCNAFTAIYASVVIFSILGFKATTDLARCEKTNMQILFHNGALEASNVTHSIYLDAMSKLNKSDEMKWGVSPNCTIEYQLSEAAEGTGLAFIVFTQAIVNLPGAPFWAVLFFTMLLSLGLGSQIGLLEGMLCTLFDIDIFKRLRKQYVTATVCLFCFIVGLIFCTGAGEYWLKMFDSFAGTIGLVVIALMEMISVIYIYGHEKFSEDIYQMTGYRPGLYWQWTWRYIGPAIMFCILISSIVCLAIDKPTYSAYSPAESTTIPTEYPSWVMGIGVSMIIAGVLPIPLVYLLRRFQILKVDLDIHQGSIRRNETTASTKQMMDDDDDEEFNGDFQRVSARSDSDDDDDDDLPPMIGKLNMIRNHSPLKATKNVY